MLTFYTCMVSVNKNTYEFGIISNYVFLCLQVYALPFQAFIYDSRALKHIDGLYCLFLSFDIHVN